MDAACLNVEISNLRKIIFAGGWSNEALKDTQVKKSVMALSAKDLFS